MPGKIWRRARRRPRCLRELGLLGFTILILAKLSVLLFGPALGRPDADAWLGLVAASLAGIAAYTPLTIAMRTGEAGAVTPFRYTRLFAMIAGIMIFGERPDLWVVIGSTLIILAGITALRLNRRSGRPPASAEGRKAISSPGMTGRWT